MTMDGPVKQVGCLGALAIPFGTVAVCTRLLVAPRSTQLPGAGPYRTPPPNDSAPRPLTPGATRFVAVMILGCTLLPALALAARGLYVYRDSAAGLVGVVVLAWIAMFVGHLVGAKLFAWLEPRLPRVGGQDAP